MKRLLALLCVVVGVATSAFADGQHWIPRFAQVRNLSDCGQNSSARLDEIAKFQVIYTDFGIYNCHHDAGLNMWQSLKARNPNIKIYAYRNGPGLLTLNEGTRELGDGAGNGANWLRGSGHGCASVSDPDGAASHPDLIQGYNISCTTWASDIWTDIGRRFGWQIQWLSDLTPNTAITMNITNTNWLDWYADNIDNFPTGRTTYDTNGLDGIFCDNCNGGSLGVSTSGNQYTKYLVFLSHVTNLSGGTGYTTANNVAVTGGTGSGMTVNYIASGGTIQWVSINNYGAPDDGSPQYTTGNVLTITGGNGNATFTYDFTRCPYKSNCGDQDWHDDPTEFGVPFATTNDDYRNATVAAIDRIVARLHARTATPVLGFVPNWATLRVDPLNRSFTTTMFNDMNNATHPVAYQLAEATLHDNGGAPGWGEFCWQQANYPGVDVCGVNDPYYQSVQLKNNITHVPVLMGNTFRPQCRNLAVPDPQFTGWTCGEAMLKAIGDWSLIYDPNGLGTNVPNAYLQWLTDDDPWLPRFYEYVNLGARQSTPVTGGVTGFGMTDGATGHGYYSNFANGCFLVNADVNARDLTIPAACGGSAARIITADNYLTWATMSAIGTSTVTLGRSRAVIALKVGKALDGSDVTPPAPDPVMITTGTPLSTGTQNQTYLVTLQCSGGTGVYTWSTVSGSLPTGITRTAAVISGTPTGTGDSTVTFRCTDDASTPDHNDKTFTLHIDPAATDTPGTDSFTDGSAECLATYNGTNWTNSVDGGTTNCVKTTGTNKFYGAVASFSGQVATRKDAGATDNQYTSIQVVNLPTSPGDGSQFVGPVIESSGTGTANTRYEVVVYDDSGIQYCAIVRIPGGTVASKSACGLIANDRLYLQILNGRISAKINGTEILAYVDPTSLTGGKWGVIAAGGDITKATGDNLQFGNLNVPALVCVTPGGGITGSVYTYNLCATGGTGSGYVYTKPTGTLPTGLSIVGATITGTPTVAGLYSFTLIVTDSGAVASPPVAMSINITNPVVDPLRVSTLSQTTVVVGFCMSGSLSAIGGILPYTWAITSGSLNAGLTLNTSTGQITGCPTLVGSSNFRAEVTDAVGAQNNKDFTISVTRPGGGHRLRVIIRGR